MNVLTGTTSTPPGTIVVGVDASGTSDRAVTWAARQAALEGRALTLVHGIGVEGAAWLESRSVDGESVLDVLRDVGQEILDQAATTARWTAPDVEIHTVMPLTDPRLALLEIAERAALLVVGSRGRGPVAELVLGSVSHTVTRHPPCPVVVVGPLTGDQTADGADRGAARNGVLVGVDADGTSSAAVELAYRQASLRHLHLTVLHCFLDLRGAAAGLGPIAYDTPGLEEQRLILDETVAGLGEKFPDVDVTLALARGRVGDCLVQASGPMDLVVVGAHPRTSIISMLFDPRVDQPLADRAPTVVVVVPEPVVG